MLSARQLLVFCIRPTLNYIGMGGPTAEALILGTAVTESGLMLISQNNTEPGPALGLFQMERATHDDIWTNFIDNDPILHTKMDNLATIFPPNRWLQLAGNIPYAAAMCRVHYRRVAAPIPSLGNFMGMAEYWKQYYNTPKGAGTVERATPHFKTATYLVHQQREGGVQEA